MALTDFCMGVVGYFILTIIILIITFFIPIFSGIRGPIFSLLGLWMVLSVIYHYNTSNCTGWILYGNN